MELDPALLIGPAAGLAISLTLNFLFYSGKVLSRSVVPREDYDEVVAINASYAPAVGAAVQAVKDLTGSVERLSAQVARRRAP